jgi:hypothetical protein
MSEESQAKNYVNRVEVASTQINADIKILPGPNGVPREYKRDRNGVYRHKGEIAPGTVLSPHGAQPPCKKIWYLLYQQSCTPERIKELWELLWKRALGETPRSEAAQKILIERGLGGVPTYNEVSLTNSEGITMVFKSKRLRKGDPDEPDTYSTNMSIPTPANLPPPASDTSAKNTL